MIDLAILADDFTGALDTGVKFAGRGLRTVVLRGFPAAVPDGGIVVIDTGSRHLDPASAARAVAASVGSLRGKARFYYKKTDSTLRGNIGAEIEALLRATGEDRLAFIPAYPAMGRTTEGGIQLVDGVLLELTDAARDPIDPVTCSSVAEILGSQTGIAVSGVPVGGIPSMGNPAESPVVFVFDASTDEDLTAAARTLKRDGGFRLFAGCAGFAARLPDVLGLPTGPSRIVTGDPPALAVCGSVNPRTMAQAAAAERSGWRGVRVHPDVLFGGAPEETQGGRELIGSLRSAFAAGERIILKSAGSPEEREENDTAAAAYGLSGSDIPSAVAASLARITGMVLEDPGVGTLLVFGGDTAGAILDRMGVHSLVPSSEPLPGVVVSEIGYGGKRIVLVTKAGGFGGDDVIGRIDDYFRRD